MQRTLPIHRPQHTTRHKARILAALFRPHSTRGDQTRVLHGTRVGLGQTLMAGNVERV